MSLALPAPAARPTLLWCYAVLAPAMIFILTGVDRGYQTDLWHHLARGREIWATKSIVSHDVFTYTVSGQPLVDNNWLTQAVAWKLFAWGGIDLLQAVNSLLLAITVAMLVGIGVRLGASARAAGVVGVIVVAGLSQTLLIRPQTVSMLLFASVYVVLIGSRARLLWILPLLMTLWANVHGAFPIGLILIGCFAFGSTIDAIRRLRLRGEDQNPDSAKPQAMIVALFGSTIATLANPYGWRVYEYVLTTSSRGTHRVIQEWLRPDVFSFHGALWLVTIVSVVALVIIRLRAVHDSPAYRERNESRTWMLTVIPVFAIISCSSVRMSIWWFLAAGPVAMTMWSRRGETAPTPSPVAGAFYAAILAAMVICLPGMQRWNPVFSLRPADRLEDDLTRLSAVITDQAPGARIFARLEWGEYFSFAIPWKHAVFMDGRIEIYGDDLWDEYRRITSAQPDWQALLDKHQVNVLVLDRHYHDGLIERAARDPMWRETASVGTGIVYIKSGIPTR